MKPSVPARSSPRSSRLLLPLLDRSNTEVNAIRTLMLQELGLGHLIRDHDDRKTRWRRGERNARDEFHISIDYCNEFAF